MRLSAVIPADKRGLSLVYYYETFGWVNNKQLAGIIHWAMVAT